MQVCLIAFKAAAPLICYDCLNDIAVTKDHLYSCISRAIVCALTLEKRLQVCAFEAVCAEVTERVV